eukprot:330471_1
MLSSIQNQTVTNYPAFTQLSRDMDNNMEDHQSSTFIPSGQSLGSCPSSSQPIACPLHSFQDYEEMAMYEEEKMYYESKTWSMYSRITEARQKQQQQEQQRRTGPNENNYEFLSNRDRSASTDSMDEEKDFSSFEEEIFHIEI